MQSVARTESFRYGGGQSVALAAKLPPVLFGRAVGDESPPTGGWGDGYVCVLRGANDCAMLCFFDFNRLIWADISECFDLLNG